MCVYCVVEDVVLGYAGGGCFLFYQNAIALL